MKALFLLIALLLSGCELGLEPLSSQPGQDLVEDGSETDLILDLPEDLEVLEDLNDSNDLQDAAETIDGEDLQDGPVDLDLHDQPEEIDSTECGPNLTLCEGACVNTYSDDAHCGECSNACTDATRCQTGRCLPFVDWWNDAYERRKRIVIQSNDALPESYTICFDIDHQRMISEGVSIENGDDIRIVRYLSESLSWQELSRALMPGSHWNQSETRICFSLENALGASTIDQSYYLYYDHQGSQEMPDAPDSFDDVFWSGEDFEDLPGADIDLLISGNGSASISNGHLVLSNLTSDDVALAFLSDPLPEDRRFVLYARTMLLQEGLSSTPRHLGIWERPVPLDETTTYDPATNPRRLNLTQGSSGFALSRATSESWLYWLESSGDWVPEYTYSAAQVGEPYDTRLLSDGQSWSLRVQQNGTTIMEASSPLGTVLWDGHPYWVFFGSNSESSSTGTLWLDHVAMMRYVDTPPELLLGNPELRD